MLAISPLGDLMMRRLTALLLLGVIAAPAIAQTAPDLPARVTRIEKELRAVQRKVFPDGKPLEAEITAPTPAPQPAPTTTPLTDLTARVDAMETQIRAITAQAEQNGFRLKQLEDQVKSLADAQARAAAAPTPAPALTDTPVEPSTPGVERPSTGDAAEDGYVYGFRLWQAKMYPEAEAALKTVAEKYSGHRRASFAQNLLGRLYLDQGKPALAAVALYDSYKKWPKGERAPESLYWLGQALIALKKPADACKVYGEFDAVYAQTAAASLKTQIASGRKQARCA
jgi:TolA-binding protein